MKDTTPDCSPEKRVDEKIDPLHRIFLAIVVTAGLYFNVGSSLPDPLRDVPPSAQSTVNLSESVVKAVLHDVSERSGLPASALLIVDAQQQTFADGCMAIADSSRVTSPAPELGWQVTVQSPEHHWVYHINKSGSQVKLDKISHASAKP